MIKIIRHGRLIPITHGLTRGLWEKEFAPNHFSGFGKTIE